jgi:cytochrome c oxidase subunit 2
VQPSTAPRRFRRGITVAGGLLVGAVLLGGCQAPTFGAFRGATTQGQEMFRLWVGFCIAGLAVTAFVAGLIFWASAFHRRRHSDEIPRQFHEHIPLEITYTVIPFIIVGVLFYFTVLAENKITAVSSHPNEIVNVLAYRWGWRFSYETGSGQPQNVVVETSGQPKYFVQPFTYPGYPKLVLPINSTIRIDLQSADVVHGFYIPEFNFSRYAQPGYNQQLFDFTTTKLGWFRGQCTQYCGLYHSEMLFSVQVVSQSDFAKWLTTAQAAQAGSGAGATS